jgi:pyruvate dehydrogenase E2 component (dihydrolipoamide acetyltransferase)
VASERQVLVPDIGDFHDVEVIEVLVAVGDTVAADQTLITLESDKATMEIPSPAAGVVRSLAVRLGDKVNEGSPIATLEVAEAEAPAANAPAPSASAEAKPAAPLPAEAKPAAPPPAQAKPAATAPAEAKSAPAPSAPAQPASIRSEARLEQAPREPMREDGPEDEGRPSPAAHASPSVRRLARELGVDLSRVTGSGRKHRVRTEDVQAFVKSALAAGANASPLGLQVAPPPDIDFAKFGAIEVLELPRIRRLSGRNLHRSWVTIPHVTQFDEADVTDLETFRRSKSQDAEDKRTKLTLLAFLLKAAAVTLKEFPRFNSSLDRSGEALILKKYFHIGVAVDTENGLVVPVIRDVDRKGLLALAEELADVSRRARERKLRPEDLAGGCFSISSLGGIGGTAFTPIVNAPEVAILGVSRTQHKPVWIDGAFQPRLMLPLSLSYDHRVIDGAEAVRFTTRLRAVLSDIRNLIL